jgi:integrase
MMTAWSSSARAGRGYGAATSAAAYGCQRSPRRLCPEIHFHDLRHTGNILTATAGASLRELMARMGHASTGPRWSTCTTSTTGNARSPPSSATLPGPS